MGTVLQGTHPGLIHRDVKSSNVLLDGFGQAYIADFGLALYTGNCSGLDAAGFEIHASNDADILTGTYGYSAPECNYGAALLLLAPNILSCPTIKLSGSGPSRIFWYRQKG